MRTIKLIFSKIMLRKALLLTVFFAIAFSPVVYGMYDETGFSEPTFINFIWQFAVASFVGVWSDAWKYVLTNVWDWQAFKKDIGLPFVLSLAGGIGLYLVDAAGDGFRFLFAMIEGSDGFTTNYVALYGAGYVFANAVKMLIKRFKKE